MRTFEQAIKAARIEASLRIGGDRKEYHFLIIDRSGLALTLVGYGKNAKEARLGLLADAKAKKFFDDNAT